MFKYLGLVLVAMNQLFNTLTGGQPDMATSARAGIAREKGSKAAVVWCKVLDVIDPRDGDGPEGDHCEMSANRYRSRALERAAQAGVIEEVGNGDPDEDGVLPPVGSGVSGEQTPDLEDDRGGPGY